MRSWKEVKFKTSSGLWLTHKRVEHKFMSFGRNFLCKAHTFFRSIEKQPKLLHAVAARVIITNSGLVLHNHYKFCHGYQYHRAAKTESDGSYSLAVFAKSKWNLWATLLQVDWSTDTYHWYSRQHLHTDEAKNKTAIWVPEHMDIDINLTYCV